MDDFLRIVGIGMVTAISVVVLKETKPAMAVVVGVAGGLLILLSVIDYLTGIFSAVLLLIDKTGLDSELIKIILQIIGVGYLAEFAAGVCEESGCKQIGDKIVLGGKLVIMTMALPIIVALIELITELLQM